MNDRAPHPTLSVYTTCRNEARYLADTLDSILAQTFEDFEIALVDGASTDGTLDILRTYEREPRLKWISEPDEGPGDGFYKAMRRATGTYVMCLPVSDCYLSPTWFEQCVEVLERDPDVSMVHGNVMRMRPDGALIAPLHPSWTESPPPGKFDYFAYWLATFMHASEVTYCVRRSPYLECYPPFPGRAPTPGSLSDPLGDDDFARFGPHMKCLFNFHTRGYLASYLPVMATGVRENLDNLTISRRRYIMLEARRYTSDIRAYRDALLDGRIDHVFRSGRGETIRIIDDAARDAFAERVAHYRATARQMFDVIDDENVHHRDRVMLFRRKWAQWCEAFGPSSPVAIYAGGLHTEQLLEIVGDDLKRLNVIAIVDQRPTQGEQMRGIPIVQKCTFDFSTVDRVIVSSKAYEAEIYAELLEVLPPHRIERIYGV
ncbi:MAG TPA: glycosyltransferase [Vicinamibacterales bacterium]